MKKALALWEVLSIMKRLKFIINSKYYYYLMENQVKEILFDLAQVNIKKLEVEQIVKLIATLSVQEMFFRDELAQDVRECLDRVLSELKKQYECLVGSPCNVVVFPIENPDNIPLYEMGMQILSADKDNVSAEEMSWRLKQIDDLLNSLEKDQSNIAKDLSTKLEERRANFVGRLVGCEVAQKRQKAIKVSALSNEELLKELISAEENENALLVNQIKSEFAVRARGSSC